MQGLNLNLLHKVQSLSLVYIFRKKNNNWRNETHYSETLVYTIVSFFYEIALVQLVYASLILLMHTSTASFSIHQHMLCAALHAAAARV